LPDSRRVARVETIAEAMAVHPGRSIPQLCHSPYAVKATYTLFNHEEATPENMQAGHRASVLEALRQPGVSLLSADTTELSWAGTHPLAGLGPLGNSAARLQGFVMHPVLSVRWTEALQDNSTRWPVEVIGVGDQQSCGRTPCRQPRESSPERRKRARESPVWTHASQRVGRIPQGVQGIRVAEREADISEYLLSVEPSRDREAHQALIYCGTQCGPLGRIYIRGTPKATTPCAHSALVRECHRRNMACPRATGIRAGQKAAYPMSRWARLGSSAPGHRGEAGMAPVM
jgi:hypothetical protein